MIGQLAVSPRAVQARQAVSRSSRRGVLARKGSTEERASVITGQLRPRARPSASAAARSASGSPSVSSGASSSAQSRSSAITFCENAVPRLASRSWISPMRSRPASSRSAPARTKRRRASSVTRASSAGIPSIFATTAFTRAQSPWSMRIAVRWRASSGASARSIAWISALVSPAARVKKADITLSSSRPDPSKTLIVL